jgi:hypothetical protein
MAVAAFWSNCFSSSFNRLLIAPCSPPSLIVDYAESRQDDVVWLADPGQLARARLGLNDVVELRSPPEPADAKTSEALRAASILYRIGEGDLALAFVTDLAEESRDPGVIAGLGKLTARYNDAQAMLLVGKAALARGMPMDHYAYPDIGVPSFSPVGSGRLGGAHPVLRDAQLCPARHGESAGVSRALRRQHRDTRAQPTTHRDRRVALEVGHRRAEFHARQGGAVPFPAMRDAHTLKIRLSQRLPKLAKVKLRMIRGAPVEHIRNAPPADCMCVASSFQLG